MTKQRNYNMDAIILILLLIVFIILDLKDIFFIPDGKLPYVWLGILLGTALGQIIRKEKQFETLILPISFLINYILYRIGIYIPNRMLLYLVLTILIIYYIHKSYSKWQAYKIAAVVLLLIGYLTINYNMYSNRIIKDRGLNRLIKKEFEIEGNITEEDLANIEKLSINDMDNIIFLDDIYLFKNLKVLYFWDGNIIIDYSPISNLKNLEKLTIWYMDLNKLAKINAITSLKHLELLYPKKGRIHDLVSFPNITTLELQGISLNDLSKLSGPEHLDTLHINDGVIESFNGIEMFHEIETLSFYNLNINNFDDIFNLEGLKKISLQGVQIKDFDRFEDLADSKGIALIKMPD